MNKTLGGEFEKVQNRSRREVLKAAAAIGAVWSFPAPKTRASALEEVRLGFISCGSRAGQHLSVFTSMPEVRVAALCDPDGKRLEAAGKRVSGAMQFTDLRDLIDQKDIDAVVIASCNHWHCLASIWAMQAGKDVYVEKPLSHSQWEGDQTVRAARKYGRICQVGTQQRSDPMQAEIKEFLHRKQNLGKILGCRVNRYGVRAPIGKRSTPLKIDPWIDYDLWLGPAQEKPIFRDRLHYDWHWDFNTGSGEMGNWGVHVLDDARNNVFLDQVRLPRRIAVAGGRVVWDDAGDTPNVHFAYFDTGKIPTVIGLSNLPAGPGAKRSPEHPGPGSGYIVYCEGGRLEGQRGKALAFDQQGKLIREFKGNSGNRIHQQNFIDCVISRDPRGLNADVEVGNLSTGWCNLANIGYLAGRPYTDEQAMEIARQSPEWDRLREEMQQHLAAYGVELSELKLSTVLEFDEEKGQFVGPDADRANRFLKRQYRAPYVVPEITL